MHPLEPVLPPAATERGARQSRRVEKANIAAMIGTSVKPGLASGTTGIEAARWPTAGPETCTAWTAMAGVPEVEFEPASASEE